MRSGECAWGRRVGSEQGEEYYIGISAAGMASQLPLDLQYIVEEDNMAFQQEMDEYDARKERIKEASQVRNGCTL